MDVNSEGKQVAIFEVDDSKISTITDSTTEEIIFASPHAQDKANEIADSIIARAKK